MAEEIDPALIDKLNKLGIVFDTASSSMAANNKTLKRNISYFEAYANRHYFCCINFIIKV